MWADGNEFHPWALDAVVQMLDFLPPRCVEKENQPVTVVGQALQKPALVARRVDTVSLHEGRNVVIKA
jgi:hypothetical protein